MKTTAAFSNTNTNPRKIDVSVIVPVYNTALYLAECLDSILAQDIVNMEILVINDCSTDKSGDIINEYAKRDSRIVPVFLKENIGLGPVRNKGIKLSKGKWVALIDSDDIMQLESLKQLWETGVENKTEIVIGSVSRQIDKTDGSYKIRPYLTSEYFLFDIANTNISLCPALINIPPCWSILYNRTFLKKHSFQFKRRFQEDQDFVLDIILHAKKVCIKGETPYIKYRQRIEDAAPQNVSITKRGWNNERFGMMLDHLKTVINLFENQQHSKTIKNLCHLKRVRLSFYLGVFTNSILREILQSNYKLKFVSQLEECAALFEQSELTQTGLEYRAETLSHSPQLAKNSYYELALHLLINRHWGALGNLLEKKALTAEDIISLEANKETSSALFMAVRNFLERQPNAVIRATNWQPRLVPHSSNDIIIHIGMTKTGSTAIQNYLECHRKILFNSGIVYPVTGIYKDIRKSSNRNAGHQQLISAIKNNNKATILQFFTEISNFNSVDKVILSAENFFHYAQETEIVKLKKTLGGICPKIVVYLRRQDSWLESFYGESISGGHFKETRSFPKFAEAYKQDGYLDYISILNRWSNVFGQENIIVRPYDKKLLAGSVVSDFCEITGIGGIGAHEQISLADSNVSPLSKVDLLFLRELNHLPFKSRGFGYLQFIHEFVDQLGSNTNPRGVTWFKDNERKKLLEEFEEPNRLISEKFLNGKPLFSPLTDQELGADQLNDDEDIAIPAEKLKIALNLYHQFLDKAPKKEMPGAQTKEKGKQFGYNQLYRQGCFAFHSKNFKSAIEYFTKEVSLQPENSHLRRVLAESLIQNNCRDDAIKHLEKAHSLLPNNKAIRRRLFKVKYPNLAWLLKSKPFQVPL